MPTPTLIIPFGESSNSSVFALVELDTLENVDEYGETITTFYDTELVNILVHTESGATVKDISTSLGTIINPNNPNTVTRTNSIENIVFKGAGEKYTIPHYPNSNINMTWKGRTRTVSISGREITCLGGAGICDISYSYSAKQYILEMTDLGLEEDEDFLVEVSYKIEK